MTSSLIAVLSGTITSIGIKAVDVLLAKEKERRAESVQDRDRLSTDIWKLLGELRNDYDRLDAELRNERSARQQAEEQVREMGGRIAGLQDQVTQQEIDVEKYKMLAEERLDKISSLAKEMTRLQNRVNELEARDRTLYSATAAPK